MTNFSSENSVELTLNRGMEAAKRQNWSAVNRYLRQLPVSKNKTRLILPTESDWKITFQLASTVLLEGDFQEQWEVAKSLPLLGNSIAEPLIELLEDEAVDSEVRWFICSVLGKFPEPKVVLSLVKLLQETEIEELAVVAGKTLTQIGTAAIDALVELLPRSQHRHLAVKSLAYIRRPEIITPLITVVDDRDPEIRTVAIEALGSFHDERIPLLLLTALKDTSSSVRKEAANALGFRPDLCEELDLVAHLQPLLYDFNLEVCSRAAFALGRMKHESAVKALFIPLNSSNTPVSLKLDLVRALAWSETELAIDYLRQSLSLRESLSKHDAPASDSVDLELLTLEIINVLGRIKASNLTAKASGALIDFWQVQGRHDSSPELKQLLSNSLGELQDVAAKTVLQELANDEHQVVRLHAIAALKKLPESLTDETE